VQPRRRMLLDNEGTAALLGGLAAGLGGDVEATL
jgi:hypothetical protein